MHHSLTEVVCEHIVAGCVMFARIRVAITDDAFTSLASPTLSAVTEVVIYFVYTNSFVKTRLTGTFSNVLL